MTWVIFQGYDIYTLQLQGFRATSVLGDEGLQG